MHAVRHTFSNKWLSFAKIIQPNQRLSTLNKPDESIGNNNGNAINEHKECKPIVNTVSSSAITARICYANILSLYSFWHCKYFRFTHSHDTRISFWPVHSYIVAATPNKSQNHDVITDTFGRIHTYLRISLTERCNLRCKCKSEQLDLSSEPIGVLVCLSN